MFGPGLLGGGPLGGGYELTRVLFHRGGSSHATSWHWILGSGLYGGELRLLYRRQSIPGGGTTEKALIKRLTLGAEETMEVDVHEDDKNEGVEGENRIGEQTEEEENARNERAEQREAAERKKEILEEKSKEECGDKAEEEKEAEDDDDDEEEEEDEEEQEEKQEKEQEEQVQEQEEEVEEQGKQEEEGEEEEDLVVLILIQTPAEDKENRELARLMPYLTRLRQLPLVPPGGLQLSLSELPGPPVVSLGGLKLSLSQLLPGSRSYFSCSGPRHSTWLVCGRPLLLSSNQLRQLNLL